MPSSPRLSFYLRDCSAILPAPYAPSVDRAHSRDRSPDGPASVQSSMPERLWELRLRRRPATVAALSCTERARLRAVARSVKTTPRSTRYFLSDRIQVTRSLMSASDTCAFGGLGIWPQVPTPPFFTFSISIASALASPRYLAATSL